jgi:lipopolysaccharide biosynthesis glycosyltransferase
VTLHVAFVTDRAYLPWCATALLSCVDQHPSGDLHVHVLHDGTLAAAEEDQLRALAPATPVSVHAVDPEAVQHLPAIDRFGHIVWLRFLLPELMPHVERVLYLDADTFVAAPLTALADLDLEGAPVGAVLNVTQPADEQRLRAVGLDPEAFFNSGVLLLDLAALRRVGFIAQVADAVSALGGDMQWPDQDVLNIVFRGRWHRLHPRYNAQNSLFDWAALAAQAHGPEARQAALDDPAIVHFEGPVVCKPWHVLSQHPWRDRFRAVLARTPWSGVGLEDDRPVTRAIRRLPVSWQLPVYEQVVRSQQGKRPSLRGALRRHRTGAQGM